MSVRVRFAWSIALVALSGCAVTVQGSPGSDAAVPGSDAAVPADAQASVDGATPPMRLDVPAGDSTVFFPDAPLPTRDVPRVDSGRPPLGFSFVGTWRAVALEFEDDAGQRRRLLDTPTVLTEPGGGASYSARVNGTLRVEPRRFVYGIALVTEGHVLGTSEEAGGGLNAGGTVLGGTLDDATGEFRFAPGAEGSLQLRLRPDGTITLEGQNSPNVVVFARDPSPAQRDAVQGNGAAQRPAFIRGDTVHLGLFWDLPGMGYSEMFSARSPFDANELARFSVTLTAPPPAMVRGNVRGVPLAVGYPSAYLDRDTSNSYTPADGERASPSFAVAWRGEGDPAALAGTAFEDLPRGYSLAVLALAYPGGVPHLVPLDNTLPIEPDVPLRVERRPLTSRGDLPNLVP